MPCPAPTRSPASSRACRAALPTAAPADIRAVDAMMAKIKAVYERYGFEPVETPFVEYTEALGKFLPDQDRPNEGVFSFQDEDEQWLSLRYDLTAPLARYVAENFEALPKPFRSYRAGWVFRNEKPGPGRFRQFMQFDADTVGAASPAADAEICMMAADTMEALGFERGAVRHQGEQPEGSRWRDGGDRARRRGECRAAASRCCGRSTSWIGSASEGVRQLLGAGTQGRERGFHEGRRARRDAGRSRIAGRSFDVDAPSRRDDPASRSVMQHQRSRLDSVQTSASDAKLADERIGRRGSTSSCRSSAVELLAMARSSRDRSLGRPRPRILHRPGLRGAADLRGAEREGRACRVRLGRRGRAL